MHLFEESVQNSGGANAFRVKAEHDLQLMNCLPPTRDRPLRIKDDEWQAAAIAFLAAGVVFVLLGLLSLFSQEVPTTFPRLLTVAGVLLAGVGSWLIFKPAEVVIDIRAASVTLRNPLGARSWPLTDVLRIEIRSGIRSGVSGSLFAFGHETYDEIVVVRDGTELVVGRGLSAERALEEATQLAKAVGIGVLCA